MDSIRGSSRPFVGSCSLLPDRARGRQGPVRPPGRRAALPSRFRIKRKPEAERISNLTSYRTSRTFTATMKAKTTRSGLIGTRSVWDKIFDRMLPDSSAWALVSSRMIRKRMSAATAAAPKLPARNVDVTVTTVVIMRCSFPFNKFVGLLLYINTSPMSACFEHQSCESSFGRRLLPLPLAAAPADEGRDRRRNVRADPDPAVADAQDERRVQHVLRLCEAVISRSREHHARDAEDEGRGRGGPDDETSKELLPLNEPRAAPRDFPVRRLDRRDIRDAARLQFHRPRVPSRAGFDLAEALEQLVDVPIDMVSARGRVRKRRRQCGVVVARV